VKLRQMSKRKTSRQISRRKVNRRKMSSRLVKLRQMSKRKTSRWNKQMVSEQDRMKVNKRCEQQKDEQV
jgi:hypothetical protein